MRALWTARALSRLCGVHPCGSRCPVRAVSAAGSAPPRVVSCDAGIRPRALFLVSCLLCAPFERVGWWFGGGCFGGDFFLPGVGTIVESAGKRAWEAALGPRARLDRIEAQSKEDKAIAQLALTWVATAKCPLSVAELLEAIAIEPDTKSLDREGVVEMVVLSVCAGLVIVDQDGTVRLIHYTTQKYLDGVQASKFPFAQRDIAQACLTYLLYNNFAPLPENREELETPEQEHALFDYSFQHRTFENILTQDPHLWDEKKGELLYVSSSFSHMEMVELLLEKGWRYGNALQATTYHGQEAVVRLLIEKGANVNAQGGIHGNALQATSYCEQESIVQLLIEKGADVNAQGGEYGNALQAASYWGHEAIVQLLIDKGVGVNAQGGEYGNALQAASLWNHKAVVQLLIKKGANVNAQGGKYGNVLQAACYFRREGVVRLLIEKGVDVNAQGGEYGSALQAAAADGNEAVPCRQYGSALQAAADNEHNTVVQWLLAHGADARLLEEASGSEETDIESEQVHGGSDICCEICKNPGILGGLLGSEDTKSCEGVEQ
ncbi:ankyrin repeat-containing domain protein [Mycena rebaudengoi]|nr:ankyrin repeat-containing domain protein [Mycena rebaudengoi]